MLLALHQSMVHMGSLESNKKACLTPSAFFVISKLATCIMIHYYRVGVCQRYNARSDWPVVTEL